MTYIATIRQRGQLTLPEKVRRNLPWLKENSPVNLSVSTDKLTITPHTDKARTVDPQEIWDMVELMRSFPSQIGSLSEFVIQDRHNH